MARHRDIDLKLKGLDDRQLAGELRQTIRTIEGAKQDAEAIRAEIQRRQEQT